MKHTPGPWTIGSTEGGWTCVKPVDHNLAICNLVENNEANAVLIAVAPDLLEACKNTVISMEALQKSDKRYASICEMWLPELKAVIAKADND